MALDCFQDFYLQCCAINIRQARCPEEETLQSGHERGLSASVLRQQIDRSFLNCLPCANTNFRVKRNHPETLHQTHPTLRANSNLKSCGSGASSGFGSPVVMLSYKVSHNCAREMMYLIPPINASCRGECQCALLLTMPRRWWQLFVNNPLSLTKIPDIFDVL